MNMRIITANVNGIRSAEKKGFFTWLQTQAADVVCLQETKAQMALLKTPVFYPAGFHCYYADAQKKGYSGVGILSKKKPDRILTEIDFNLSKEEGRYIQADFDNLSIISLYLPSGSSGDERQNIKWVKK